MNITINQIFNNLKKNDIKFTCKTKNTEIIGLHSIDKSEHKYITFFHNVKYINELKKTKASYCFIEKKYSNFLPKNCIPIIVDNSHLH